MLSLVPGREALSTQEMSNDIIAHNLLQRKEGVCLGEKEGQGHILWKELESSLKGSSRYLLPPLPDQLLRLGEQGVNSPRLHPP